MTRKLYSTDQMHLPDRDWNLHESAAAMGFESPASTSTPATDTFGFKVDQITNLKH